MRRSDQIVSVSESLGLSRFVPATPLPRPVLRDFVDMLFNMRLPILALGLIFVGVTALIAYEFDDRVFATLAGLGAFVTFARLLVLEAYRRARPVADAAELARWERFYAIGNYAFASLLALLNICVLAYHYPLLHSIAISMVFGFGAGIGSRISIRPRICVVSILVASVPTVVALFWFSATTYETPLQSELFAIEALLVTMFICLALQSVIHLYRSAVEHHTARYEMAQLARHDALTGLANRLLLRECLRATHATAVRRHERLAVHFIDLDGFKAINDNYGHLSGDAVLIEVAHRLEAIASAEDTVARLGGDEFVIVQSDVTHPNQAELLARRIIRNLGAPYVIDGRPMSISASVGIALGPDIGDDIDRLLHFADTALYRAKAAGKARVVFCTEEDAVRVDLNVRDTALHA